MQSISKDINACVVNQFTADGVLYEIDVFDRDAVDVPHCHVVDANNFECCIRLDAPGYFIHGNYTDRLPSKNAVDAFNECMKRIPDVPLVGNFKNSWDIALWNWNRWHSSQVSRKHGVLPDYSKLGFSE